MKADTPGVPELSEWLAKLPAGARVGIDPFVHTNEGARKLVTALELPAASWCPCSAATWWMPSGRMRPRTHRESSSNHVVEASMRVVTVLPWHLAGIRSPVHVSLFWI